MEGRTQKPAIEVVSIRWERVQVIVEARLAPGTAIDPGTLGLRQVGRAGRQARGAGRMPPTHVAVEDGHLTVRFNVMSGPGLDPLEPGRWVVDARVTGDPKAVDPSAGSATFQLANGLYSVTPAFDPGAGAMAFVVAIDEGTRRRTTVSVVDRVKLLARGAVIQARRVGFRLLVWSSGVLHRPRRKSILFASALISEMSGNLKAVHDRMVERGLDRDYELLTILRPKPGEGRGFLDRVRLARALAGADAILIDDSFPPLNWLKLRPETRIIQLWHAAGAFKTVGYSRVGKPAEADRFARVHKDYTAAIVSSDHDVPFYAEAFGIPESRIVPTGIPRMDRFFDAEARAAGLAAARAAFPQLDGRRVILYAPTFRGSGPKSATFDFDRIDYPALHAVAVEKDAVVIIKMHPFVTEPLGIPEALRDRLIDGSKASIDVNDLLFAVDLLITDYSSIVFEYSTLGRPMLFYAYDLNEYIESRDFYVPFESFVPGRIVQTFPELVDAIRREDFQVEKVAAFATRHFAHLDGGSSDRVIDQLVLAT